MRNLTSGNKVNFTIFAVIVFAIVVILCGAIVMVLKTDKEEFTVSASESIYDKNYNYIELSNDAKISKKWTGSFYLKEDITKKEYDLGNYAVAYDKNRRSIDLFGNFYQVLKGGDIKKISGNNRINNSSESQFYKIDDRKYLIVAKSITNNTGSLSTQDYLIVIIDKLGNALLLNNEINAKTINEMTIDTGDFSFDVANESLKFENEEIDLKKIIGSTNEHKKEEKTNNDNGTQNETEKTEIAQTEGQTGTSSTSSVTTANNKKNDSTTVIQNSGTNSNQNNNSNNNSNNQQDNSWTSALNNWIQKVASGFQSIYNGNSGKKENTELTKSIALNSLSADTTSMNINYQITDPENKYNIVYAIISDGVKSHSVALDKNATSYRVTGLDPNKNYTVQIGYKVIYADSTVNEQVEDTMTIKTKTPVENLSITKVSTDDIYYILKLDNNFVYDAGAKLTMYLNDNKHTQITLNADQLGKAASTTGYAGSFAIPDDYKIKNSSLKLKLENVTFNGSTIDTNLMTKIINY